MKSIFVAFLICYSACGPIDKVRAAVKTLHYCFPSDTSISKLLQTRISTFKAIPVENGTDNYYVKLMLALYDGANDMIKMQAGKISDTNVSQQSLLFQRFHDQMSNRYVAFLAVKSHESRVNPRFKAMADVALQHFSRFEFQQNQTSSSLLTALLIEFYENMDQISVAFISMGESERLKKLAWDSIKKQNALIDLLNKRQ
ncbi:hypothetical protein G7092_17530 [Mucilaginibacter sp. HC2]|jgi:hypothetical protein|uniref:hypothetical protein n=1 Tax=Mucilaginibacter TaxID=423349 RepID=UPI000DCF10B0|nr:MULTISPECIES: hypothetical protein [Mucilaginibacter]NHA05617.1 hypothetical protein [Mucilaginibacter inviolabilis]QTE35420.1 hypothetical protein J3L18_20005 [Mucilaginibacter gossypii]RAV59377.1 hypothetical protein DIU36_05995 [Mucilaginibacter rubeus]